MLMDDDTLTAVDKESIRRWKRYLLILAVPAILALAGLSIYRQQSQVNEPVTYANDQDHFKYGSITSDSNGIPYWIWKTLPEVCPGLLPGGYASLGVVQEPGKDTPIGFSKRRKGLFEQVGPNCALCHTTSFRKSESAPATFYLTGPSNQLDIMGYFKFLFGCARDPAFTAENVIAAIEKHTDLGFVERFFYNAAIPQLREALLDRGRKFDSIIANRPPWGPGRVDTFNPYKVLVFNLDMSNDKTIGTADFMSIWNQGIREGIWLHWDGNNDSVDERNLSASIGAGATPETLNHDDDIESIMRIKRWILTRPAPAYPYSIDLVKAAAGKPIYDKYCGYCHEVGSRYFGEVTPLKELGTDPARNVAFDQAMAARMNTIGEGSPWHFHRFRKTDGYANHPLDGIWLRGPYLHNGSVPTLRDLLKPPTARPTVFYRGNDVFNPDDVGFVYTAKEANGRTFYEVDTRLEGNGNGGHNYGTDLPPQAKDSLLEYLKTL